jgi:NitT/TauT family transport system substrate-binding protein
MVHPIGTMRRLRDGAMNGNINHSTSRRQASTRRTTLKLAAGAALAGIGALVSRPARAATKLRVLTNFYPESNHGGLYQALATGLYEKAGLDVTIRPGGPQIVGMQLLIGGETDVVMGASISVLTGIEQGVPAIVIMPTFQFDPQVIVTRPDIGSLADLKGHKILVSALGRGSYWLWLKERFGLTDDQVAQYTGNFQPFLQDPSMALGGVVTSEPFFLRKAGADIKYFLLAQSGYPPYGYPLVAMQSLLNKDRDAVARFVRATLEGWKSYMIDPAPGLKLIKEARPDADDEWLQYAVKTARDLKLVNGGDAQQAGIGVMTEARWKQLADFMTSVGLLKPSTDWRSAYTTEFVKDLKITF